MHPCCSPHARSVVQYVCATRAQDSEQNRAVHHLQHLSADGLQGLRGLQKCAEADYLGLPRKPGLWSCSQANFAGIVPSLNGELQLQHSRATAHSPLQPARHANPKSTTQRTAFLICTQPTHASSPVKAKPDIPQLQCACSNPKKQPTWAASLWAGDTLVAEQQGHRRFCRHVISLVQKGLSAAGLRRQICTLGASCWTCN